MLHASVTLFTYSLNHGFASVLIVSSNKATFYKMNLYIRKLLKGQVFGDVFQVPFQNLAELYFLAVEGTGILFLQQLSVK